MCYLSNHRSAIFSHVHPISQRCKMPTQSVPAASLRTVISLPARVLLRVSNYLIYSAFSPIGRSTSGIESSSSLSSGRQRRLQITGAARHGLFPQIGTVVVEDQLRLSGRGEPVVAGELAFELTRSPTRVAERKEALRGAPIVPDVAQDLSVRRHRHAPVDLEGLVEMILGAVDDKAELLLHRPAGKDPDA